MKAVVYTRYGPPDVVQISDVERPVPKHNEVLIKVCAASVNLADWRLLRGVPHIFRILFWLRKPTIKEPGRLGHDVAGQVESVGRFLRSVAQFKPGDEVFGACAGSLDAYACAAETRWRSSPTTLRSSKQLLCPSRRSPRCRVFGTGKDSAGTDGPHQRCGWRRGYLLGADRQSHPART
jgi:NADPH:quinone reductase-like Zn-dependent oxidoreductase